MNDKIFDVLEFQKIQKMLEKCATSQPGRLKCKSLMPETDIERIQYMQDETSAARERIKHNAVISFSKVTDLSRVYENLENGASLTPAELLRICDMLDAASRAKVYGCREVPEEARDILDARFNQLSTLSKINQEIRRCIRSDTELFDTASAGLEKTRRKIKAAEDKIQNQLRTFIGGKYRNYLSETFISQRDGAYCLAVKYACRNKVSGTVHGQSGTGGTVFIEPKSVADTSSELQEHKYQEQIEIAIVLGDLSDMIKAQLKYVKKDYAILTELDFIFAKAYLSEEYNGAAPLLNRKKIISIKLPV